VPGSAGGHAETKMSISQAKSYVGKLCSIQWTDHLGRDHTTLSIVHDVLFLPLYGGYLVTDATDISLEWIRHIGLVSGMSPTSQPAQPVASLRKAA